LFREDLRSIKVSRLRALGEITAESTATVIRLGDSDFSVGLALHRFPNGGSWSLFRCPQCDRAVRTLWLLEERPACRRCCMARGVGCKIWPMSLRRRAEYRIPKIRVLLGSETPARLHPRPDGSMLDRRRQLENSLRLAELTLRRHRFGSLKSALAAAKKGD
jgi:hypothetical protein